MKHRLLVIDDDAANCRLLTIIFGAEGFEVDKALDGESGLAHVADSEPDLVLLDLNLPGLSGMEVLERLKVLAPKVPVVMLTGSNDVKNAVRAIRLGAFDYLTKPMDHDEVVLVARRALQAQTLQREVDNLRRQVETRAAEGLALHMGSSPQVKQIIEQVRVVAASTFTVLVLGETGTGKELVAREIHQQSDRHRKPFVALDCGAIPELLLESELFGHERGAFTGADRRKEGRLRLAEGGTCFLDEVGNLPMSLQVKLLRVLESRELQPVGADRPRPMDVRFVAATNEDLQSRVTQGLFRSDLYFRLAQYTITLPPLRERVDDIGYLAQRFAEEVGIELRRPIESIMPDAIEILRGQPWPGNVRELRNAVRQAVLETNELVIRSEVVRASLGSPRISPIAAVAAAAPNQTLREIAAHAAHTAERQAIVEVLRANGGNKSQAARTLKTDYKTLHVKMKSFGIQSRDFRLAD
jgi:DNA-binding NtrC family response regulator